MQSFVDRVRDRAEILHRDANQHHTMIAADLGRIIVQTCCSTGRYMEGVHEIVSEPQTGTAEVHAGFGQRAVHGHNRTIDPDFAAEGSGLPRLLTWEVDARRAMLRRR